MPSQQVEAIIDELYLSFNQVPHPSGSDRRRHPEHTRWLLNALGHPDEEYPVIMVTGSKGKGSTAYYLSELLRAHGLVVGFFSSPGFLSDLDRIRVNGQVIPDEDFIHTWNRVRPHWIALQSHIPNGQYVGPVGLFATIAAQYFKDCGVDWAVIETGRGARFDDVAQIAHADAVITNVLAEHVRELGPSLEDIAWHKLGIVHPETQRLFLSNPSPLLKSVMAQEQKDWPAGMEVIDVSQTVAIRDLRTNTTGTTFTASVAADCEFSNLVVPTVGPTVNNLAAALAMTHQLLPSGLSSPVVEDLIPTLTWPGRGQILSRAPYLLLDASIHRQSAQALIDAVGGRFNCAVLSLPNSKDREGVQAVLETITEEIIYTTCTNTYLSYDYTNLPMRAGDQLVPDVHTALAESLKSADESERILWIGTVSFVADCYRHLNLTV